jgi:hypothetical protein
VLLVRTAFGIRSMHSNGDLHGRSGRNVRRPAASPQVIGAQNEPGKEGNEERRTWPCHDDFDPAPRAGLGAKRARDPILALRRAYRFFAGVKCCLSAAPRQSRKEIPMTTRYSCFSCPRRAMASSEARLTCCSSGPHLASDRCTATATCTGARDAMSVGPPRPPK